METTNSRLGVAGAHLELPPFLPASVAEGEEAVVTLEQERERERLSAGSDEGALWWAERRLAQAREGLEALRGRAHVPPVAAELMALRLSDAVGMITAPGEIFTETAQSVIAGSPFPHTLFAAYANGTIGYVPTRAAYAEGGYEVTHACSVAPESGEQIAEASLRLLRDVHGAA
jgi:hypothetical protein